MRELLFEGKSIVKKFGPTVALNDVNLKIYSGEIRGFIGENGSGKSTMSAIMSGIHKPTSGEMFFQGKERKPKSMIDALNNGIGICVQENGTVADISIAENIFLGELSRFSGYNYINHIYEYPILFSKNFGVALDEFNQKIGDYIKKSDEILKSKDQDAHKKIVINYKEAKTYALEFLKTNIKKQKENNADILEKANKEFIAKKSDICKAFEEDSKQINEKFDEEIQNKTRDEYLIKVDRKDFLNKRKISYINDLNEITNELNILEIDLNNDIKSFRKLVKQKLYFAKHGTNFKETKFFQIKKQVLDVLFRPFVNRSKLYNYVNVALKKANLDDLKADEKMSKYNMQKRKLVEMAKVLYKNPRIFIVDETTNALTEDGRQLIYKKIDELKKNNNAVLFISHDLDEIMKVCDVLTILRDGKIVGELTKEQFDPVVIKKMMIGREMDSKFYRQDYEEINLDPKVVLKIENGNTDALKNINIELHKGEILGIGGLSDCGMHEVGRVLFGAKQLKKGVVKTGDNLDIDVKNERVAMKNNIGYVSKDRDFEALSLKDNILTNITISSLNKIKRANFLVLKSDEKKLAKTQIENLSIKCNGSEQIVSTLSGGNKQKVSLAKRLANGSDILILDCPTRGVDIGVKQFIYDLLFKMKLEGKSILMISEELPELIGMSDRILIMKNGEVTKEFFRSKELTQEEIVDYMI